MIHGKGVANPSFRQRTAYHAMLLGGMAMITSALIVIGDKETHAAIELRKAEDMKRSLSQVIPPETHSNDLLKDVIDLKIDNEPKKFYIARADGKAVAAAFEITGYGYAGPIDVMVGINSYDPGQGRGRGQHRLHGADRQPQRPARYPLLYELEESEKKKKN